MENLQCAEIFLKNNKGMSSKSTFVEPFDQVVSKAENKRLITGGVHSRNWDEFELVQSSPRCFMY